MERGLRIATLVFVLVLLLVISVSAASLRSYSLRFQLKVLSNELDFPTRPLAPLRLLALGDLADDMEHLEKTAAFLEKLCREKQPDLIVLTGDNFRPHGVFGTDDPQWQRKFERLYASPCLLQKKFFATLGNHDYEGDAGAQIEYTGLGTGRWNVPARNFVLHAGGLADLLFVDTNFPTLCLVKKCDLDKLLDITSQTNTSWRFVIGHHPISSTGGHQELAPLARITMPYFLCRGKIDAMISGHDHNLQHQIVKQENLGCAMHQFVSGGGGATLYPVESRPGETAFALSSFGVLSAEITMQNADFSFYTPSSVAPVYSYRLTRSGATQ